MFGVYAPGSLFLLIRPAIEVVETTLAMIFFTELPSFCTAFQLLFLAPFQCFLRPFQMFFVTHFHVFHVCFGMIPGLFWHDSRCVLVCFQGCFGMIPGMIGMILGMIWHDSRDDLA